MIKGHLFQFFKKDYILGKKPDVACILCAMLKKDQRVTPLLIHSDQHISICANLFPYNPGHIMIFPNRCVTDLRELTPEESQAMHLWNSKMLDILDQLYSPKGYNIGYNMGDASGASIKHLHLHIIPRYHGELGMVDLIGGAKIMIEDPNITLKRIKEKIFT
jgi:ATP adenylyltransferase